MSFGFSIGDVVQLGNIAWTLYTRIQNAPAELKVVADDVGMLHYTLKSMDENIVKSAILGTDAAGGLQEVSSRCREVLAELEPLVIKYGRAKLSTWHKIKWQRVDIEGIQRRLKAALQALNSFNSAMALLVFMRRSWFCANSSFRSLSLTMNSSQEEMIKKLNKIQADVQAGQREGSVITRAEFDSISEGDPNILNAVIDELESEGVSKEDIGANKPFIARWIVKGIKSGAWEEQEPQPLDHIPSLLAEDMTISSSSAYSCRIEILSAAYASMDVTEKTRKFFTTHLQATTKSRTFVPSNTFFGRDPVVGWHKAFVMVWRLRLDQASDGSYRYSTPNVVRALQDERVTINYETKLVPFEAQFSAATSGPIILDASWFNMDVTKTVERLIGDRFALSHRLFARDPYHGGPKFLVLTFIHRLEDYASNCQMLIIKEDQEVYVPMPLTIHAAMWSTMDVTDVLRAQISVDQTLQIATGHSLCIPDPWISKRKTIVVIYQYGNDPLQIAVSYDGNGVLSIDPNKPRRPIFFNPMPPHPQRLHVLAAVWGIMPIDLKHFGLLTESKEVSCTNEWFGYDGWPNHQKTCHVFVRYPQTGKIVGVAAREGERLKLPVDTLHELEAKLAEESLEDSDESPEQDA